MNEYTAEQQSIDDEVSLATLMDQLQSIKDENTKKFSEFKTSLSREFAQELEKNNKKLTQKLEEKLEEKLEKNNKKLTQELEETLDQNRYDVKRLIDNFDSGSRSSHYAPRKVPMGQRKMEWGTSLIRKRGRWKSRRAAYTD